MKYAGVYKILSGAAEDHLGFCLARVIRGRAVIMPVGKVFHAQADTAAAAMLLGDSEGATAAVIEYPLLRTQELAIVPQLYLSQFHCDSASGHGGCRASA